MNCIETSKILFTDLDGTLLNDNKEISSHTRNVLLKAIANGHKIVLTSGRPLPSILPIAQQLDFLKKGFYTISFNGGLIFDNGSGQTLFKSTVPLSYVRYLFDRAQEAGLHCHTYTDTHVLSEHDTPELQAYTSHIKMPALITDRIEHTLQDDPIKLIVINQDRGKLRNFQKMYSSYTTDKFQSVFSSDILLEYGPLDAEKGRALHFLCSYLNIPVSQSIAAGDADNDISMLQAASIGAAMNNASDNVKHYADYITTHTNNEDGIAEIIETFML